MLKFVSVSCKKHLKCYLLEKALPYNGPNRISISPLGANSVPSPYVEPLLQIFVIYDLNQVSPVRALSVLFDSIFPVSISVVSTYFS